MQGNPDYSQNQAGLTGSTGLGGNNAGFGGNDGGFAGSGGGMFGGNGGGMGGNGGGMFGGNSGGGGMNQTGQMQGSGGNGDLLDKGVNYAEERSGHPQSRSTTEKVSDAIRSGVKKVTGKDVPIKDKQYQ